LTRAEGLTPLRAHGAVCMSRKRAVAAAASRKKAGRRGDADGRRVRQGKEDTVAVSAHESREYQALQLDRSRPPRSDPTDDNDPGCMVFGLPSTPDGSRATPSRGTEPPDGIGVLLQGQSPTGTARRPAPPCKHPRLLLFRLPGGARTKSSPAAVQSRMRRRAGAPRVRVVAGMRGSSRLERQGISVASVG